MEQLPGGSIEHGNTSQNSDYVKLYAAIASPVVKIGLVLRLGHWTDGMLRSALALQCVARALDPSAK